MATVFSSIFEAFFHLEKTVKPPKFTVYILFIMLCVSALGVPATDYVMEGRVPVRKLGGLSLPLDPPARETLSLLHRNG